MVFKSGRQVGISTVIASPPPLTLHPINESDSLTCFIEYEYPMNFETLEILNFNLRFLIETPATELPTYFAPARSTSKLTALADATSAIIGSVFRSILRDASLESL